MNENRLSNSMEKSRVKVILFDLDNTLIDTSGAGRVAIQKVCDFLKTALGHEDSISDICQRFAHKLFHESYDPSSGRTIDDVRVDHWQQAIRESEGVDRGIAVAAECYRIWKCTRLQLLTFAPAVRTMLEELRRTHRLLLLTNGESQTQREKVQAIGSAAELFSAIVVGGEHPEEKPALSIFTYCFRQLGVQPQDCIMVGDNLGTDIQGGFNAGVRATVWVNASGQVPSEGSARPDYSISTVLDLPGVLADLK
ncbi:N-acylneuraminate-9-phosphatase [Sardina pilchardus]|uniref:N-acylneuraminate-9-phosphatase n=1 Tax=Sardina pilchardus TaxID=27697 RepID=UPI002E10C17D